MNKFKKRAIYVFLSALVVLFIIIYIFPNITGALKKTVIIEYGGLQITDHVTGYFVRNESVYFANKTGSIKYLVEEGEQVRKGVKILDITAEHINDEDSSYEKMIERIERFNGGESIFSDDIKKINSQIKKLQAEAEQAMESGDTEAASNINEQIKRLSKKKQYIQETDESAKKEMIKQNGSASIKGYDIIPEQYISQTNGVVSYYLDGYESEFSPENISLLSKDKVEKLKIEVDNLKRETTLSKEPLFKIVDNSQWFVIFWVRPENIVKYEKGKPAVINLPLGQVEGMIYDIIDDNGEYLVILEFNRYYEEFAKIRKIDIEVITSDYKGLKIYNESITTKEGQPGVYVIHKSGEYVFVPVKIITSDGVCSLVEVSYFYTDDGATKVDTVNIYDEILKKPSKK